MCKSQNKLSAGKLAPELLESVVLSNTGAKRPEVLVPAAFGEDCAVIDVGADLLVVSTDPITAATIDAGSLVVHVSCNDVAASGAEPFAMLLTVMVPVGTSLEWVESVMRQVSNTADSLGVQIVGGHTEVTPGLTSPVLSGTVLGRAKPGQLVKSGGAKPKDALLLTRAAGIEGTAILAADYADWSKQVLGEEAHLRALAMGSEISVVSHARIARDNGATAMHDVTEGGVLGAAYEMAQASGCGVVVEARNVPVRPETKVLCEELGIDPLRLISSGCLLIATPTPQRVLNALSSHVDCAVIGRFVAEESAVRYADRTQELRPPEGDELWRAKHILGDASDC
jgi:hydrogenase maturation factor